ncbi:MAG: ubiquinol-cytochrome c reductase cytochrome b subunit [Actinobacteria bacterium]|nr:ubiquinol-cytochrome c reductase cytochrome b subunit [Actinomycetota bacterium]
MDERFGLALVGQSAIQKIFPNHWSFLLGELALYSFVVLVGTGIYLSLFFNANTGETTYAGSYQPLQGVRMSNAYASALDISFETKAGLLTRQVHHWAALIFIGAIVVHLARVFFTGAFRRPRELNWVVGITLFLLAIVNGFAGYSLLDDQLSGTGLRIGYSVLISIPVVGTWLASLIFGGEFPGTDIIPRLFVAHVLIVPLLIMVLIAIHLAILVKHKHAHFPGAGATDNNVVGERLWPTYTFKAAGLFFLVFAVEVALGGFAQVNPIWLYGPFAPQNVSSASQPDWYMGWLEGALRLMPPWETRIAGFTIPNPFWAGVVPPGVLFGLLYAWPWIEARFTKDHAEHHVLDRPRDRPVRTALGVGVLTMASVLGFAGSDDVLAVAFNLSINGLVWTFRVLLFVGPLITGAIAYKVCLELQRRDGPLVDPVLVAQASSNGEGGGGSPGKVPPSPEPAEPVPADP